MLIKYTNTETLFLYKVDIAQKHNNVNNLNKLSFASDQPWSFWLIFINEPFAVIIQINLIYKKIKLLRFNNHHSLDTSSVICLIFIQVIFLWKMFNVQSTNGHYQICMLLMENPEAVFFTTKVSSSNKPKNIESQSLTQIPTLPTIGAKINTQCE